MNRRLVPATAVLATLALSSAMILSRPTDVKAGPGATPIGTGIATPIGTVVATPPAPQPFVTAGYRFPIDNIVVVGRGFTPFGQAVVYILEASGLRARDVVPVSAQGTFVDSSTASCDFRSHAITAYDTGSGHWSTQFVLSGNCPVAAP
jgi:hypothetical protein